MKSPLLCDIFAEPIPAMVRLPCGCTVTPEQARSIRASINAQLRVTKTGGSKGGRPKGAKDRKPRVRRIPPL
jgi:hypothetical protein